MPPIAMMWMDSTGDMKGVGQDPAARRGAAKRREYGTAARAGGRALGRGIGAVAPLLFAGFVGAVLAGPALAAPRLELSEPVHDFGTVDAGKTVQHEYILRNTGDAPLHIQRVYSTCSCTVAGFDKEVAPGARGSIRVELATEGQEGAIAVHLEAYTNDPENAQLMLTVKADVRAGLVASPGYVRFVVTEGFGEAHAHQVVLARDGRQFAVTGVSSPYSFVEGSFHLAAADERIAGGAGPQWVIDWTLRSDAPVGPLEDFLEVSFDLAGVEPLLVPISGRVSPPFEYTPAVADLGEFTAGEPVRTSVRVRSRSEQGGVTAANTDLAGLSVELVADEGGIWFVVVQAQPDLAPGEIEGVVRIRTDDRLMPVIEVPVRGLAR